MACCGDVPTLETLAAVQLLREHFPALKVRVVNVVNLMKLQPQSEHPQGLSDRDFDTLFTADKPIIFAYHGYPWLIHRLTYRRTNHKNLHVRGFKEEGTTSTPFDMVVMNDLDRFHLVADVIDRVLALGPRAGLRQTSPSRQTSGAPAVHRPAWRRHAGNPELEVEQPQRRQFGLSPSISGLRRRQHSSMANQATELRYAVRFRVVGKYFGQLCLALAALTLVPLVMSVIFGDTAISLRYGIVIVGIAAFGAGLARLRAPSRVQANEGMVLVRADVSFHSARDVLPDDGLGVGFSGCLLRRHLGRDDHGFEHEGDARWRAGNVSFCPRLDAVVWRTGYRRTLPGAHYATGSGGEGPGCHRGRHRRFGRWHARTRATSPESLWRF